MNYLKSMAHRRCGHGDAGRLRRRLRVERVPHPVIGSPRLDFSDVTAGFEIAIFVLVLAASAGRL